MQYKENQKAYNDNFKLLVATVGTKEQCKYVEIERTLNRKDIRLQEKLGILLYDPCPLKHRNLFCPDCTGYYFKKEYKRKYSQNREISTMCKGTNSRAIQCMLKDTKPKVDFLL